MIVFIYIFTTYSTWVRYNINKAAIQGLKVAFLAWMSTESTIIIVLVVEETIQRYHQMEKT